MNSRASTQGPRFGLGRFDGSSLRLKIVSLVVVAALLPALLVGVASYSTALKIQAQEARERLNERAAAAERQMDLFFQTRFVEIQAFARSQSLEEGLRSLESALQSGEGATAALAHSRMDGFLLNIQEHDESYEGLVVFDSRNEPIATTAPSEIWRLDAALMSAVESGYQLETSASGRALLYLGREIRSNGRTVGSLLAVTSLDSLWTTLHRGQTGSNGRLRIVDGRHRLLYDSDSYPDPNDPSLQATVGDLALSVRVGESERIDESGRELFVSHRFESTLQLATLAEISKAEALAASRRFRDFALRGSLLTVALLAFLASFVAFWITRPVRDLTAGVERAGKGELSHRIEIRSKDELGYLTMAVNQMLDSLEKSHSQLERLATIDELTGIYNRRHLAKMFDVELNRAGRSGRPLSVLMIDLDHFKAFNDHFGHAQGDSFLRHVSNFLKSWLRGTDVLARYGGEEFTVLLPDTDAATALEIAERLRERFAETQAPSVGDEVPVTLSIGVACWEGDATIDSNLIEAADKALYEAKRNGRNRVRVAA